MKNLSTIGYVLPVESISRKFALRKEKAGLMSVKTGSSTSVVGPVKFFGGSARKYYRAGSGLVSTNVLFLRKNRSLVAPTAEVLEARQWFAASSRWAAAARKDLSAITHNQQVFVELEQNPSMTCGGLHASGYNYSTFLFAYAYAQYKSGSTPAGNHQLPEPQ